MSSFYARRLKRLSPGLILAVVIVVTAYALFVGKEDDNLDAVYYSGQLSLVGMANLYYATLRTTYWDKGAASLELNPFTHCWSLGVEEQFYLVFPLLIAFTFGSAVVPTMYKTPLGVPHAVLVVLTFLSIVLDQILQVTGKDQLAFYLMPARFWQLCSGALLFELLRAREQDFHVWAQKTPVSSAVASWVAFFTMVFCFNIPVLMGDKVAHQIGGLTAVVATIIYIGAGSVRHADWAWYSTPNTVLSTTVPVYIGKLSYHLYLFHWPAIVICKWGVTQGLAPDWPKNDLPWILSLVIFCAIALFSYHIVEKPIRTWRAKSSHALLAMGIALLTAEVYVGVWRYTATSHVNIDATTGQSTEVIAMGACGDPIVDDSKLATLQIMVNPVDAPITFGRSAKYGCGCRFCEGSETTLHQPKSVVTDKDAPLCLSTDQHPPMFNEHIAEAPAYQCFYPRSAEGAENGGMPTDAAMDKLVDTCLSRSSDEKAPKKVVYLVGDSHSMNLIPTVTAAVHGVAQVRYLAAPGRGFMPPYKDADYDAFQGKKEGIDYSGSTAFYRDAVLKKLEADVQEGDIVIIHNFWKGMADTSQDAEYMETEIVNKILAPKGASLLLFSDWANLGCQEPQEALAAGAGGKCLDTNDPPCFDECVVAQEADQTIVNLGRAQQCFRSKRFEVCDKYGKPEGARARDFVQLAEKNEHVYYFDIYELFVDTASEKTSSHFPSAQRFPGTVGVNLPGTKTVWEAWENIEQNDFSSHMSLVGSIYTWPYVCEQIDEVWESMSKVNQKRRLHAVSNALQEVSAAL
jgi:peptidoglycan/LPS O-acetylase OafA/YrhL